MLEAQYRQEYEHAAQQLSAELSVQAAQQLNYLETETACQCTSTPIHPGNGTFTDPGHTATGLSESSSGTVNAHLSQAEAQYQGAVHQQNQAHEITLQLQRELLQAQNQAEKATKELRDASRIQAEERDFSKRTLSTQAELWQAHLEHVKEAESAMQLL